MTKRYFNGYAGLGGNVHLLGDDVEVVSVEKDPKIAAVNQDLHRNHTVIVGDAHAYFLEHYKEFDFAWFSPPCQENSKMVKWTRHDAEMYTKPIICESIH